MDIATFFRTFGWQISLVALIGTLIVGWLKTPVRRIVTKKSTEETLESNFDVVAFILGFCVALIIGVIYSALATNLGWVDQSGTFGVYVYNSLAVWAGQIIIYQIWKKLGVKRICLIAWTFLKNLVKGLLDKNKDGVITVDEAFKTIEGLVKDGTLSINQVLDGIAYAAPSVIDELLSYIGDEAGDDATVDTKANISKLHDILSALADKIPVDQIGDVVGVLLEKLTEEMNTAAENFSITEDQIADISSSGTVVPGICSKRCTACTFTGCRCKNCKAVTTCANAPLQPGNTCPLDKKKVASVSLYSAETSTSVIEKLPDSEADIGKISMPTRPRVKF